MFEVSYKEVKTEQKQKLLAISFDPLYNLTKLQENFSFRGKKVFLLVWKKFNDASKFIFNVFRTTTSQTETNECKSCVVFRKSY